MKRILFHDLLRLMVIGLAAALLAFLRLPVASEAQAQEKPVATVEKIDLVEFQKRLNSGIVLLDARAAAFYDLGHIPGAKSVPREEVEEHPLLREIPKESKIIVYCSDHGCDDSLKVAAYLVHYGGFEHVAVFEDGYEVWEKAGLPIEKK